MQSLENCCFVKTYISLLGFDTSQMVSLIVKYGIEGGDRIILIRPEDERDSRGEATIEAITALSRQIDSSINVDIHRVDHHDFEGMVVSLIELLRNTEGEIIVNISGGPREIFLAFTLACVSQPNRISRITNYSDIDRSMKQVSLPNIVKVLDDKLKSILSYVDENQPITISEVAEGLGISESTASRKINELANLNALNLVQNGKKKEIFITLSGKMLL